MSSDESYRGVLGGLTALGERATLIVTRQILDSGGSVWLTLDGGMKTTFAMTVKQSREVRRMLAEAEAAAGS